MYKKATANSAKLVGGQWCIGQDWNLLSFVLQNDAGN